MMSLVMRHSKDLNLFDPDQPRDENGRWSSAGASSSAPAQDHEPAAPAHGVTSSPAFKTWFKDSKVVDSSGKPLVVYHGTTHDFDAFRDAGHSSLNTESDWGAGVYFTSHPEDASDNYAGTGPDLSSRIENRAEELVSQSDDELSMEDATARAREELIGSAKELVIPVYLSMQKPFVVGDSNGTSDAKETYLTQEFEYEDPDNPESDIVGEKGELPDFISAMERLSRGYDSTGVDDFLTKLREEAIDGISATDLDDLWRKSERYIYDNDTGKDASSELFRLALEEVGFDGVIDRRVDDKFGTGSGRMNQMSGMDPDTTHFVIFKANQAKSAIGNSTFNPRSPKLTLRHAYRLGWCTTCGVPRYDCDFDPGQPRDDHGRWTDGGGGGAHGGSHGGGHDENPIAQFIIEHVGPVAGIGPYSPSEFVSWTGQDANPKAEHSTEIEIAADSAQAVQVPKKVVFAARGSEVSHVTSSFIDSVGDLRDKSPGVGSNADAVSKTGRVEDFSSEVRSVVKQSIVDELSTRAQLPKDLVQKQLDTWAESSTSGKNAVSMQLAVKSLFNLRGARIDHLKDGPHPSGEDMRFIKAEYEATQKWFKDRGIEHVSLFRGMRSEHVGQSSPYHDGKQQVVDMQPASAWSVSPNVAMDFASMRNGAVLSMRVPVSRILSTALTGRGCLSEGEMLVLGGPTVVTAHRVTGKVKDRDSWRHQMTDKIQKAMVP